MLDPNQFFGAGSVPVAVALVELVKRTWPDLPKTVLPALSLCFGLIINIGLAYYLKADYGLAVLLGVVFGLAASGVYSGSKATVGK